LSGPFTASSYLSGKIKLWESRYELEERQRSAHDYYVNAPAMVLKGGDAHFKTGRIPSRQLVRLDTVASSIQPNLIPGIPPGFPRHILP
jgi:hypothetical protein